MVSGRWIQDHRGEGRKAVIRRAPSSFRRGKGQDSENRFNENIFNTKKKYFLQFSGNSAIRSLTEQEVERCQAGNGRLSETDEFHISATGGVGYMGRLTCLKYRRSGIDRTIRLFSRCRYCELRCSPFLPITHILSVGLGARLFSSCDDGVSWSPKPCPGRNRPSCG